MKRREFFQILPIIPLAIKGAFSDQPDKENPTEKIVSLTEKKINFRENYEYPKTEEMPELLQNYAKKFSSWIEVEKAQKDIILCFLDSERYKTILSEHFREYFPSKTESEIKIFVDDLIKDRKKNILEVKVKYKKIKKFVGLYIPSNDKMILDTIGLLPGVHDKDKKTEYEVKTTDMLVPIHEYTHASQQPRMMLAGELLYVLKLLGRSKSNKHLSFWYLTTDEGQQTLNIDMRGRTGFDQFPGIYIENPYELIAFLMQIRTALHVVSQTNKNIELKIPVFNMHTDVFTRQHLDFLNSNQDRIFATVQEASSIKTKNIFSEIFAIFGGEDFINLMNKAI